MIRPALTIMASIMLFACGGGDSSSSDPVINSMDDIGVRKIGIDLVNVANESVDFFIKENGSSNTLFDDGNKVATNLNNDTNYHAISWTSASAMRIDLGVKDTNTQTKFSQVDDVVLNNSEKLWAIAWLDTDDNELQLSTTIEEPSPIEGKYRIRVFSQQDTRVQVISTAVSTVEVKKGNFSAHMTLNNCNGELFFGANSVDICNLDQGKSYLLISDGEDLLLAEEEK
ncbi:hypothetical protein L4D09_24955 [Photobacterium makurazakiensis]|uniref:hypothetical protein n=1 Tax=Photobacterium makurazakiensis TaxID=2910234 RepID=UPI003D09E258